VNPDDPDCCNGGGTPPSGGSTTILPYQNPLAAQVDALINAYP
jgi:hypothetical protein